ncbi:MAG: manganese-binding transcriptional regulator MntR [Oligoflexia bacterium]|nr:manganese-binding transcriptional regulator MntR [Oligoflexia bacterium]
MTHQRTKSFKATRSQHSLEMAQDYTELISDLLRSNGQARTCEIARLLGVSHVTAVRTLRRLKQQGLVSVQPHRPVELTAKGERMAAMSRHRHQVVVNFLVSIGVPSEVAELDSEGIEHHISDITLACLEQQLALRSGPSTRGPQRR